MDQNLRGVMHGAIGGAVATIVMSGVMAAGRALGMLGEPPPRKLVGKAMGALGLGRHGAHVDVAAAIAHLAFGAGLGAAFGGTRALSRRVPSVAAGLALGAMVWEATYAGLIPKMGLMLPPALDRPGRQPIMLAAHLVYGGVLGGIVGVGERHAEPSSEETA